MPDILSGRICGSTIVLTQDPQLPTGQSVEVELRLAVSDESASTTVTKSAAGMLVDYPELDAELEQILAERRKGYSMIQMLRCFVLGMLAVSFSAAQAFAADDPDAATFAIAKRLGRGINMGNALEAPKEGEWGMELKAEYFEIIAKAGFNSVRIPIRWSAHAQRLDPYTIDEPFFERVDWAIEQAQKNKLMAVINVHHYEELDKDPLQHIDRLTAFWKQIAARYQKQPDSVVFELYNEPHDKLVDQWSDAIPKVLAAVRATNPNRAVIIGPTHWNRIDDLPLLKLPEGDRHIIVTFHYYDPFHFTHQDTPWNPDSRPWKGTRWTGSEAEKKIVSDAFAKAAEWGKKNRRPMYLGEFGAFEAADMESRAKWTTHLAREAERLNFAWSYWEFGAGFGAYDRAKNQWHDPLRQALVPAK